MALFHTIATSTPDTGGSSLPGLTRWNASRPSPNAVVVSPQEVRGIMHATAARRAA
jgi:hypothetical protein